MGYRVDLADTGRKQLAGLDREWQVRVAKFLDSLEELADPAVASSDCTTNWPVYGSTAKGMCG